MSLEVEILEELTDTDPFIRSYPTFAKYLSQWQSAGGEDAETVSTDVVFEFYAEKLEVEEALHIWFTYHNTP